jgi:hypothetical protein
MENFHHFSKEATMLTAFCLAFCVCGAEPELDAPVSAEAAVQRAKWLSNFPQSSVNADRAAWLATPLVRVNGRVLTVRDVLGRHLVSLSKLQTQVPPAKYRDFVQSLIAYELPRAVDKELLRQALRRDVGEDQWSQFLLDLSAAYDDYELPKKAKNWTGNDRQVWTVAAGEWGITSDDVKRWAIEDDLASGAVRWRVQHGSETATSKAILAEERRRSEVQTAVTFSEQHPAEVLKQKVVP